MAVVIEVAPVRSHARDRVSIIAQRHAGLQTDLPKRAVALVVKEKAAHGVIRDEDVGEAVAVHIGESHPHASCRFERRFRTYLSRR